MAEGENRSGLLSKVAKFVRNPTTDWSKLDQKDTEAEGGYSKEALKEMIERKRQNDFVRKREFDHLRKLRRREFKVGEQAGRPSFFQSSIASNIDDRAQTLKKIDEIEAQMSRQWWKGKEGAAPPGTFPVSSKQDLRFEGASTTLPGEAGLPDDGFKVEEPASMRGAPSSHDMPYTHQPTEVMDLRPAAPTPRAPFPGHAMPVGAPDSVGAGFSSRQLYAPAPSEALGDPDLEDAAIRFANGDEAGAERVLLDALQSSDLPAEVAEVRMAALFDLYRATGQQASFDHVAIEFANRFGRSPPAWFSTPDLLGPSQHGALASSFQVISMDENQPDWVSPARLTAADLKRLQALLGSPSLLLDWQALKEIAPDAVAPLAALLAQWSVSPMSLSLRGYASLDRALQALTPSGDRSVAPLCWQLRMDALRIMRLQDTFELVALDYCVTYEVSPPSWQKPTCSCELLGASDSVIGSMDLANSDWGDESLALTAPAGLEDQMPAMVELSGEILGDADEVLARLDAGMEESPRLVVSCERLIRVDFPAAGSILKWLAAQQAKGCQVQFRDVNRIVAVFFKIIGITEHARVLTRAA